MPEQDDGFLPSIQTVTPEQSGAAVTKSLTDDQAKANFKRRLDELDINDPGISSEPKPEPAKPEPKAAPPAASGASAPAFAPELLARAREHGITATEAKEYGTPALLERAVAHMDRSLVQRRPEPVQRQPEPPPDPEVGWPDLPETAGEGAEWDPQLRQWVQQTKGAFDALRGENKQLKDTLGQVNQHLQRQEVERITQQWDGFFEKAPPEFKEAVGEGALADLEGTAAGDLRKDVLRTFLALQDTYQRSGQRQPSFKVLADRALRATATPSAVQPPSTSETTAADDRVRDAQGRFLSAPTARKDSVNDNKLDGDTPPADPKKREQWAANRFRRRVVAAFGEE